MSSHYERLTRSLYAASCSCTSVSLKLLVLAYLLVAVGLGIAFGWTQGYSHALEQPCAVMCQVPEGLR